MDFKHSNTSVCSAIFQKHFAIALCGCAICIHVYVPVMNGQGK